MGGRERRHTGDGVCLCEGARRQPFKILFPASEEANPAPIIPCSQSTPPSSTSPLPFSLSRSPSISLILSLSLSAHSMSDSTMPRPSHAYLTLADGRLGSMHTRHDQWLR